MTVIQSRLKIWIVFIRLQNERAALRQIAPPLLFISCKKVYLSPENATELHVPPAKENLTILFRTYQSPSHFLRLPGENDSPLDTRGP